MSYREDVTDDLENVPDGWHVYLYPEEGPDDPFKSWDMAGTFWANYPDTTAGQRDTTEFSAWMLETYEYYDREYQEQSEASVSTWGDVRRTMEKHSPGVIAYPVDYHGYMGDYTIDLEPKDHDEFSHRNTGVIYVTREKALKEWGGKDAKRVTQGIRQLAAQCLKAEIETYSQYATGDVWFYVIEDQDGEPRDSCGGLYGYTYAKEAAQDAIDQIGPEHVAAVQEEAEELTLQAAY